MALKLNSIVITGLALFIIGLILPFVDVLIIKSYGKAAESIGSTLLFASLAIFVAGVIITLIGFHKQSRQTIDK
ncbi:MAG: hypothetical protein OH343_01130 [Candidatus Parvarchaeota archaeon]|jgi:hypothetical protein|nr:hypothetical protein [Candidatus Parvarchaeota archaeon]MCW1294794.1 hypothetical protein [Candidatus Parvarchaeum tengchongense]MCW1295256.1 hypothetical protein [Candidatus Parvarchaeum tengchongense]